MMMKKIFLLAFLLGIFSLNVLSAGNISVNVNVPSPYSQCIPSQSKDVYYYIPNENVKYWPYDNIKKRLPAILVASKTRVDIWNPNNLISWCSDWSTVGNLTPGNDQSTLAFHNFDGCVFSKPNYTKVADPNKLDAQIHFSVAYWTLNNTSPNQATASFAYTTKAWFDATPRQYTCYPSGRTVAKPNECPKETLKYQKVKNDAEYHNGECLNYRVFWCGDGLLNRPDGSTTYTNGTAIEKCDPNDPNKVGWGNGGCNASCQPINSEPPVCKSDYNGKVLDNLTEGNHLCEKGTVSEFKFANNKWTWKCGGQAGTTPVDCSATKNDKVYDLALTKVISAETPAPYQTGSTVKFSITVINQGNYVAKNIEVTDYLLDGLELDDAGWTNAGAGKVVKTLTQEIAPGQSVAITLQTKISANFTGRQIRNLAEISKDNAGDYNTTDVDSTPDSDVNNDCFRAGHLVTGNGKLAQAQGCSDITDEDDHDGVDFTVTPKIPEAKYDLALTKKIFNSKATYLTGERLSFEITLYNQGNKEAKNIEVTDYLPAGLELDDPTWTNVGGGKITQTLTQTILPNRDYTLILKVKISENFTGTEITNYAEISKDNSGDYNTTDVDSTPDNNSTNDCFREWHLVTGNGKLAQAQGCSDATDEDDHDGVKILLTTPKNPNIKKELTGPAGHRYAVGELVGFKMPFKNPHNVQINNVSVRDYLPQNLEYVSSEIHGVTPYVSGQFMSGAVQVVEYSGFNLAPLQEGYLLLTGKVKANYLDQRINLVQILVNNIVVDHDTKWYPLKDRALTIEKVVDKRVLATGEVATFTIKVSVTTGSYTGLTVVDTLPAGLVYDNAWQLTGTRPNMETISFATGKNNQNLDTLTWKFKFPDTIKTGESFQIEMKTRLTESSKTVYTNKACVENPDGNPPEYCDTEDVTPKELDVKLFIKKYVSSAQTGAAWDDNSMQFSNGSIAFFKLEIKDASKPLSGFIVKDRIEGNLQYLDSTDLPDNAFTGVITFGPNNPTHPAYTIVPTVSGTHPTDIQWNVNMGAGAFMPGDVLNIILKAKKNGDQVNTGRVEYPLPWGGTGHSEDPARVTTPTPPPPPPPRPIPPDPIPPRPEPWMYYCGNGVKDWNEICDWKGSHRIEDGYLFKYENIKDDSYNWYTCTPNCTLQKDGITVAPKCFDLENGSISIMKWEVLPFYWNMESQLGFTGTPEQKMHENAKYLRKYFTERCSDAKDQDKIPLGEDGAFQCFFKVYGPAEKLGANSNVVYEFNVPCVSLNGWMRPNSSDVYSRLNSFVGQNKEGFFGGSELWKAGVVNDVFKTLDNWKYPTLLPLSSKLVISNFGTLNVDFLNRKVLGLPNQLSSQKKEIAQFGEYKIALEKVEYKTCNISNNKDWKQLVNSKVHVVDERVCEVDFAVTDPYLIQKSPYGIWNKTSTPLDNYKLKNGESFMRQIFPTSSISDTAYAVPADTKKLFTTFKNKYSKIAKSVNVEKWLSKVPWKSIYLVSEKQINLDGLISNVSKPFTLIATHPDANISINGDVSVNAMIMTQWTITFDASKSCNDGGGRKWGHAGQIVRWIYYAGSWFNSSWDGALKNIEKNLDTWKWCNYGNLHIKWVAIWDLSEVVKTRRSELYTWFKWTGWGKVWTEKKDIVINGASVLVEYNPDLWGNLPPGANEFNKVLEVYRE